MRALGFGMFVLVSLLNMWFVHKGKQHLKDPDKVFYIGSLGPVGRRYFWLGCLGWVVALISILIVGNC